MPGQRRNVGTNRLHPLAVLIGACLISETLPTAVAADRPAGAEEPRGVLTLQFENDYFVGEDRNYTHGTRFAYTVPVSPESLIARLGTLFPLVDLAGRLRATYSIGQAIFTPDDVTQSELIPDDQPYAGWLYVGANLEVVERRLEVRHTGRTASSSRLALSARNPTRRTFSEVGTRSSMRITPKDGTTSSRTNRASCCTTTACGLASRSLGSAGGGWDIDLSPHAGFALGNVYTHAAAGATIRFGPDLPDHFGLPYIRPSLPGSDYFIPSHGFSWYLFAGVEARAVARNIFLDGNTFTDSHSVDKNVLVGEAQVGFAVSLGQYRLAYTHVMRTPEFDGQDADMFGSLSLSIAF